MTDDDDLCVCGHDRDEHEDGEKHCWVRGCPCGGFEWDEEADDDR